MEWEGGTHLLVQQDKTCVPLADMAPALKTMWFELKVTLFPLIFAMKSTNALLREGRSW